MESKEQEKSSKKHEASVFDFITVENGEELTAWTADGDPVVVLISSRESQLELAAQKIRDALATYEGWIHD